MLKNYLAVGLVVVLGFGGLFFLLNKPKDPVVVEPPVLEASVLEQQYNEKSKAILSEYVANVAAVSPPDLQALTTDTLDRMLELRVPATAKDKHLGLVLSLSKLEEGLKENDQIKIDEAISQFNNISTDAQFELAK